MQELLEKLNTEKRVVGIKQVRRALAGGSASAVFLADDADPALTQPIAAACAKDGIPLVRVETMAELGKACRICVSASAAALVR